MVFLLSSDSLQVLPLALALALSLSLSRSLWPYSLPPLLRLPTGPPSLPLSLSLSRSRSRSLTLSLSHTHTLTHSLTLFPLLLCTQ